MKQALIGLSGSSAKSAMVAELVREKMIERCSRMKDEKYRALEKYLSEKKSGQWFLENESINIGALASKVAGSK